MDVIQRISAWSSKFTDSENKIATYIINNQEAVLAENITQLAENSQTSPATIIRFFNKLEFDNFNQFKILLSSNLAKGQQHPTEDIHPNDSSEIIKKKILNNSVQTLTNTANTLSNFAVDQVIKKIHEASHIYVFGVGASTLVAENIVQKWTRAGKMMVGYDELNMFLPLLETATSKDLIWFISNSGTTPEVIWGARFAKERSIPTVSLTMISDNELSKLTDLQLYTASPIETKVRSAATNSLLSQFMVIDVIYYIYITKYYQESYHLVQDTRQSIIDYHNRAFK